MQYALTLRQLHCYEASNREAFCALAANPHREELYGLIGCNLLAMGLKQEGLDALGYYFHAEIPAAMPWHDEACDLADAYDEPYHPPRRQARLDGLLSIAAHRIARGELDGAGRALRRAQKPPYQAANVRRDMVLAAYWLHRRKPEECLRHLNAAIQKDFLHTETLASAAAIAHQAGMRRAAQLLLVRAACRARTQGDQHLVCHTAAAMDMLFVAEAMLRHFLRFSPNRCPVLYDLCVCSLRMGRLQQAARHIHLCREIDPDDIPSEALFARVMEWQKQGISPEELRKAAQSVSFFGSCSEMELAMYAQPLWQAVKQGPQALADAIRQDERLRRRMLFLLTLPLEWPVVLLNAVCACLPADETEALLREVLLQHPADSPAKRSAMSLLRAMGAPAPYAGWTRGRFLLIDPDRLYAPVPTFRQRYLTLFVRKLAKACGTQVIPWALGVISRMTPAQQSRVIGDHYKVWQLAMTMRWHARSGLPPVRIPIHTMSTLRLAALRRALEAIHHADRF